MKWNDMLMEIVCELDIEHDYRIADELNKRIVEFYDHDMELIHTEVIDISRFDKFAASILYNKLRVIISRRV